jgi:hypothetical protein
MKTYQIVIISSLIISCGKSESKAPIQTQYLNDNQSLYIDKKDDMPSCNEANQRQLIYIKELEQFQFCDSDKAWKMVSIAAGKDGKDGKDGSNGKDGVNGKDGAIKNFTVYSNGKPIGTLADESPEFLTVKTNKGFYFEIDQTTGKMRINKANDTFRYARYFTKENCEGNSYTVNAKPQSIILHDYYGKLNLYYTINEGIKATEAKSSKDIQGNCSDGGLSNPSQAGYYYMVETHGNNAEKTGFEGKTEFELPITIAL